MSVQWRASRPDDRDFFFEIRREAFRVYAEQTFGPWDDEQQRADADRDFAALPIEILELDTARIGYQIVLRHADHWFLDEIALIAGLRNRGLGGQLVDRLMRAAHAAGLPLRLSVLDVNPARRLYERLGFRVTGHEPPRTKMEWP